MLRRPRRAGEAGAAVLLVMVLMGVLGTGGMGAVDAAAAVAAQSRAGNAADAVAHAAAALLAADPDRDRLSLAVQAGSACEAGQPVPDGAGPACSRAIATARQIAVANRAVLLRLTVGPDLRDDTAAKGAERLLTLALVAVPRGLPVWPARCPPRPGTGPDLCWAEAWSAAQEAG